VDCGAREATHFAFPSRHASERAARQRKTSCKGAAHVAGGLRASHASGDFLKKKVKKLNSKKGADLEKFQK
jgi:hypothetical protein